MTPKKSLNEVYLFLKDSNNYKKAVKTRAIKIVLGSSVIRVFKKGSKKQLTVCLLDINVDDLGKIKSQEMYDKWHLVQINKIFSCLKKENANLVKLTEEGLKWGHSTKILNLFIGHLAMMSPYYSNARECYKVQFFLHVPLDSKVFEALRICKIEDVPKNIKSISAKSYKIIQITLRKAALEHKIPALYFDEYAWSLN